MSPAHFKGQVVSPVERLDVTTETPSTTSTQKPIETAVVSQESTISEVNNMVAEPTSEIIKPETPAVQETIVIEEPVVASTTVETPIAKNQTISEEIKQTASRPVIEVNRPERKVSGLSLKSIQLKQKMQQELQSKQPDSQNLPTDPFKEDALIEAWKEYTALVQKAGKHILFSHLTMGEPRIEGELIHLIFPNNTIRLEVEREQGDLLGFIKKKLNNYNIDLSIEVNEEVAKKYAYTTREKFDKLNQKNPLLDKLRQTFDLDL